MKFFKLLTSALVASVLVFSSAAYADAGVSMDVFAKPDKPPKPPKEDNPNKPDPKPDNPNKPPSQN